MYRARILQQFGKKYIQHKKCKYVQYITFSAPFTILYRAHAAQAHIAADFLVFLTRICEETSFPVVDFF